MGRSVRTAAQHSLVQTLGLWRGSVRGADGQPSSLMATQSWRANVGDADVRARVEALFLAHVEFVAAPIATDQWRRTRQVAKQLARTRSVDRRSARLHDLAFVNEPCDDLLLFRLFGLRRFNDDLVTIAAARLQSLSLVRSQRWAGLDDGSEQERRVVAV